MTQSTAYSPWTTLLLIQRTISFVFMVGAIAFPLYILYRHGSSSPPVFYRGGNVIGHANYLAISLGFSAIALLISWLSYKAAQRGLRQNS